MFLSKAKSLHLLSKAMPKLRIIRNIFLQHKYQLLITYTLFGIEMFGLLLRPFFLGNAVNGLIVKDYHGLVWLAASHIVWMVAGTIRHRYDTRTYSGIYTALVTKLLSRSFIGEDVSKLSAHSTLAREMVDFLEFDLNYVVEAVFNLFGSLCMLYFYDKKVVLICLCVLVPVAIISFFYGKKMRYLSKGKNDELEKQVDVIGTRDKNIINHHYQNLRKWQIKIADMEAWNFGVMELLVLCVIVLSLLATVKDGGVAILAGDIIGIYNYVLKFVSGLDTVPYTLQRVSQLTDIAHRIELEVELVES